MSKQSVVILGGRGIGMIACSIIDKLQGMTVIGFLNDDLPVNTRIGRYQSYPVIGATQDAAGYLADRDVRFFVAYLGMLNKQPVFEKITQLGLPPDRLINVIDPSAVIPRGYCQMGRNVLLAPLSQMSPDTKISDHCFLLASAFVGHDSTLDEFVSVANNASIGGNVRIGKGAHIGSNATIREGVSIGAFSIVGMGAVVLQDVPPHAVVAGNPARVIRTVSARRSI